MAVWVRILRNISVVIVIIGLRSMGVVSIVRRIRSIGVWVGRMRRVGVVVLVVVGGVLEICFVMGRRMGVGCLVRCGMFVG